MIVYKDVLSCKHCLVLVYISEQFQSVVLDSCFVLQVSKYDDPQEAAIAVVVEAYRLWLQYEVRTDDITIIVACVDGLKDPLPGAEKKSMR